ncbi:hypothetical protein [Butyrivibrio sp. FC2001]|uniref:hypothetical protein n=1 Tax=Butyrivibrio sp. FC2001 TaxID=1280671 RepID=UPI0004229226|nr:hypothetical protein [Butyrivibrio sp. FC2001]
MNNDRNETVRTSGVLSFLRYFIRANARSILIGLILAAILEVFVWNSAVYLHNGGNKVEDPMVSLMDGTPLEYGKSYSFEAGTTLELSGISQEVKNIFLDLDCKNEGWDDENRQTAMHVTISITDEGHVEYYGFPGKLISPKVSSSMYLPIEAFGKVNNMRISISEALDNVTVNGIDINAHIPFRFVLGRFLVFWLLIAFICGSITYDYAKESGKNRVANSKMRYAAILLCLGVIISTVYYFQSKAWVCGAFRGYNDLINAFEEHRLYLEESTDSVLAGLDNPYDPVNRYVSGAESYFDTAYYQGKYYVYFGAVPAVLLFMPYHFITGKYLTDSLAHFIIELMIIIGSFLLVHEIKKKYFDKLPLSLYILFSTMISISSGVILMIKRAAIYYISIGTALALVTWGLFLWFKSVSKGKVCYWQGMLGSLLMALAVGARPQFAMYSFLAFFVFRGFLSIRENGCKNVILLTLPYFPIAFLIMAYNYLRFGSPFDFGANYNLTGYDMDHMGIHLSRIPIGLWYYLVNLPIFNLEFPFLQSGKVLTDYPGYIVTESMIGGAIVLMPVTWMCLKPSVIKVTGYFKSLLIWALVPVLIVTSVDTVMCGILTRYQMDIRLFLIFSSLIIIFDYLKIQYLAGKFDTYNNGCRIASLLCVLTLISCVLIFFAQYDEPDYSVMAYDPVLYCRMRALFGL